VGSRKRLVALGLDSADLVFVRAHGGRLPNLSAALTDGRLFEVEDAQQTRDDLPPLDRISDFAGFIGALAGENTLQSSDATG